MFDVLWRTLRKCNVVPSGRETLPKERHASSRPQLEVLEDRVMPTVGPGVVPPAAAPTPPAGAITASESFSNLRTLTTSPTKITNRMTVQVTENSPETIINLDLVFLQSSRLQHQDGLQWSMLGNTNATLVRTDLSEAELALKYTPGQCGSATITVGATDADGVSEQEIIHVMVEP
jgi:hypothetical protein